MMCEGLGVQVPQWVSPVVTFLIVGAFFARSIIELRKEAQTERRRTTAYFRIREASYSSFRTRWSRASSSTVRDFSLMLSREGMTVCVYRRTADARLFHIGEPRCLIQ